MIMLKSPPLSLLALALSLSLVGCGDGIPNADEAIEQKILLLGNGAEPETIDPHLITGHPDGTIASALSEGLIAYHKSDDNLPEPGVAESWESFDNGSRWTFTLRENARWSNGDPVTADDFVYSARRVLSPALASEYAPLLYLMENAEAYHTGKLDDFSQVGISAPDEYTLEYRLTGPTPHFLSIVKSPVWYPVHQPTIEAHGDIDDRVSRWTAPENHVGNGPFRLTEWVTNQIIKAEKNPHYWDADQVELKGVYFFPISDIHTENRAFENGQIHKTHEMPSELIARYQNDPRYRNDPVLIVYYYMINTTRPPFDDLRVRQALSLAIDRRSITDDVVRRGETPATGYTPPGFKGYNPPRPLTYDPERARQLLADAGFPNGEGFPVRQILFNNHAGHQAIAEAIQQMWKENLNIDVELYNQEWKVYLETRNRMEYDIARAGWGGDFMDPNTFLHFWQTEEEDSLNDTGWSNPRYDAFIEAATQSPTLEERYENLAAAEDILVEELPNIPVYWYRRPYLLDTRVEGWEPKLLDFHNFKFLGFSE